MAPEESQEHQDVLINATKPKHQSEVVRSHQNPSESDLTPADSVFREQQHNQQEVLSKTGSGRS